MARLPAKGERALYPSQGPSPNFLFVRVDDDEKKSFGQAPPNSQFRAPACSLIEIDLRQSDLLGGAEAARPIPRSFALTGEPPTATHA
jgi:hypothetical protein